MEISADRFGGLIHIYIKKNQIILVKSDSINYY